MSYAIEVAKSRLEYVERITNEMIDLEADATTPASTLAHIRRTMDGYLREEKKLRQEIHLMEALSSAPRTACSVD
jgi:hypothetical protein